MEIKLRKLEEKDIPLMLEWMHDSKVNSFFRFDGSKMTEESARAFIARSFTETDRHYAVADAETNEYLGTFSLEDIDLVNKHAMVAAAMRSGVHGSGGPSAGLIATLSVGFSELGLERIYCNILDDNPRCIHFVEKHHFTYEGCFRRHLCINGQWHDWKWYSILREEFYAEYH